MKEKAHRTSSLNVKWVVAKRNLYLSRGEEENAATRDSRNVRPHPAIPGRRFSMIFRPTGLMLPRGCCALWAETSGLLTLANSKEFNRIIFFWLHGKFMWRNRNSRAVRSCPKSIYDYLRSLRHVTASASNFSHQLSWPQRATGKRGDHNSCVPAVIKHPTGECQPFYTLSWSKAWDTAGLPATVSHLLY